ncbi:MAG: class I SAM-dependent methyltransferase [Candidatus Tectomicrobia bacterium]|nr:class I SAM-dependent methyltransferase [Candidatus Tectomicrobia bacterium]
MTGQVEKSFEFGRNWKRFVKSYLTDERLAAARQHLSQMLVLETLEGRTFLDIGCGSGIHSLAAYELGAERTVSFDVDHESVEATKMLRATVEHPTHWDVRTGSILDDAFVANLGSFDIVYAWGCLHHTGAMWTALKHAAGLVKAGGQFYIAIYNHDEGAKGSHYWAQRKAGTSIMDA